MLGTNGTDSNTQMPIVRCVSSYGHVVLCQIFNDVVSRGPGCSNSFRYWKAPGGDYRRLGYIRESGHAEDLQ
jgi:hypothetical protein